ncbi:MAG: 50S ribosomal protein L27 [Phycisphaeraceae bacterium]|nr:50S ribosomal protein L27 [Phycisphaeraceae bacterium]
MAHKKGQGSTENGRDSNPQYRGVRLYGGQTAKPGAIILTQCGTRWKAGHQVQQTKDYSLMALIDGTVRFRGRIVDVIPSDPASPRLARDAAK